MSLPECSTRPGLGGRLIGRVDACQAGELARAGLKGSEPDLLREQLIDAYDVDYAILVSRTFCNIHPDPDYAAAIASAYIEWHCAMSFSFQAHLVSLLTEGVFERFPGLRIVLVEGGVAWLAPLMWRLDAYWKALRSEIPWVRKPPSEYLRDHVRLATQPLERPDEDRQLLELLEIVDAEHLCMFSSDYPHWDFDSPTRAFPKLPDAMREAIFSGNARAFYNLD